MTSRLDDLLSACKSYMQELFAEELIGIYLTGSIVFEEFIEGKSDADCTVLLKSPLTPDKLEAATKLNQKISAKYKNIPLEIQYISYDNIGKNEKNTQPFYSYRENKTSFGKHNANAVTWFTLKHYGITLAGVPANELDITASVFDLKSYVKSNVNSYWRNWLNKVRKPFSVKRILALSNWGIEWCVCGISRMYYTMAEGDVTSKGKAAEYGLTCLPESFHKILREAIRIRKCGKNTLYCSRLTRRREMIEYMHYLIELIIK